MWPPIDYLRWVRGPAAEGVRIPLFLSGMPPPDPSLAEGLDPAALIAGDGGDHPPLARTLAAHWGLPAEAVLLQPGTHWNLLLAVAARLAVRPGPVVVEEPAYEPLRRIPRALGAEVLRLPRLPARGWGLDRHALDALARRRPSLLVLSHPHNPSLALLSSRDQEVLADFAAASGCAVLSDEVYLDFLEGDDVHSLRHRLPGAAVLRSFTKAMGLGPIRCSVLLGPVEWIAGAAARSDYGPVRVPAPSLAVAEAAWRRRDALWARARATADAARPLVARWAEGLADLLEVEIPPAGIVCLPRLGSDAAAAAAAWARGQGAEGPFGHGLDGEEDASIWWIEVLRRRHGVLVTPGTFFERPTAFRLGFGLAPGPLQEGLDALGSLLREACGRRL